MIRIEGNSSYSREKQQIARPRSIATLTGRCERGGEQYVHLF